MKNVPNKLIRSGIYCGALCILLFVSVVTFFNMSTAWFSENKNVSGSGMSVSVEANDDIIITKLRVLKYNIETNESLEFDEESLSEPDAEHMKLNSFDTVFTERQQYTSMVLEITLSNTKGMPFSVNIGCSGELADGDNKLLSNISNVLGFKCGISSTLSSSASEHLYLDAKAFFEAAENQGSDLITDEHYMKNSFVSLSGETRSKNNTISFGFAGRSEPQSDETITVYLYIDYDSELMDEYIKDRFNSGTIGTDFLTGSNVVVFEKDIGFISFEKNEES